MGELSALVGEIDAIAGGISGAEAAAKEAGAEQGAEAPAKEQGGEQEAVDADEETGAGEEDDELELSQATTLRLPSSAEELEERKGKSGGAGDESVSDERAVAREAFERCMHVDPPKGPPASPAVKRREDRKAMCDKA